MTYQGYSNRETWTVRLWILNRPDWRQFWMDAAQAHLALAARRGEGEFTAHRQLADSMRTTFQDYLAELADTPFELDRSTRLALVDIGSLWRVDWSQLAASILMLVQLPEVHHPTVK